MDNMKIKWSKNGKDFPNAYEINPGLKNYAFYPSVCMKNAEIKFNFGDTDFLFPPSVRKILIFFSIKNNVSDYVSIKRTKNLSESLMLQRRL